MNNPLKRGFGFGLTSGVITTLGVIVGLNSGTHSRLVVLGGIITIAIADAFSDALGMHISEESTIKKVTKKTTAGVWTATISTFISKILVALSFVIPVLLLELHHAIAVSILWGLILLAVFSYKIAKNQNAKPLNIIIEHLLIAIAVIVVTHFVGMWISNVFV